MALIDSESHTNLQRPGPVPLAGDGVAEIPHAFLARLPVLHAEAARTVRLGRFVANAVPLAGLLMLAGGLALLAGGGGLQEDFAWSALTLIGIAAIAANYIRGPARSLGSHAAGNDGRQSARHPALYRLCPGARARSWRCRPIRRWAWYWALPWRRCCWRCCCCQTKAGSPLSLRRSRALPPRQDCCSTGAPGGWFRPSSWRRALR